MAKLGLGAANLKLKWSIRLPPDKWKPRIKRGSAACNDIALTSRCRSYAAHLSLRRSSCSTLPPGVLALWNTAERVKTSKERAQALSQRAYEVLEALTDAVPDPSMLVSIQRFDDVLREARDAMVPLTKRRRFMSSVVSLNRDEATLEMFNRRLNESFQTFTIAGLTRVETQLLAIKADATVFHQALIVCMISLHDTLTLRFSLIIGLF
ncbi:hypothetical protein B0H19DRAFT_1121363 [Mycena capillaripes]|nr:hypothetical protein B0H19DRAFT_1121363 [Mycena capillaripes]